MQKNDQQPSRWLTILECIVGIQAAWIFLPRLFMGRRVNFSMAFFSMTSDVTGQHLNKLWILLAVYLIVRYAIGKSGWLSRFLENRSRLFQGIVLVAAVFLVYLHTGLKQPVSGDTIPAKLIPISILTEHDLDLDEFYDGISEGHRYCVLQKDGHWYPAYPIFPGLTALPFYAVVAWLYPGGFDTWRLTYSLFEGDQLYHVPRLLEHYSAAFIAALSVGVVWSVLRRTLPKQGTLTLCITLGYAFGTSLQSTASWALWMHGPSCLFLALMVYFLHQKTSALTCALFAAGLCAGWAVACRPTNFIPVAFLGLWCLITYRTKAWRFIIGGAIVLAGVSGANYVMYQQFFGGYSGQTSLFRTFNPLVLLTILFSPSRGLFLFSPFLLIIAIYALIALKSRWRTLSAFCLYGALALCLLYAAWGPWAGGHSFGPRLLSEAALLLVLTVPIACVNMSRKPGVLTLLWGLVILSMHIHVLGTYQGDNNWTLRKFMSEEFQSIWNVRDSQLLWTIYEPTED